MTKNKNLLFTAFAVVALSACSTTKRWTSNVVEGTKRTVNRVGEKFENNRGLTAKQYNPQEVAIMTERDAMNADTDTGSAGLETGKTYNPQEREIRESSDSRSGVVMPIRDRNEDETSTGAMERRDPTGKKTIFNRRHSQQTVVAPAPGTAERQAEGSQADTDTTRQIRQLIVDKDEFSVKAHNVNITTINGEVTLKGPVESMKEQQELEKIAKEVAGATRVNNETYIAR